ncbi:MAG: NAD(P)H-dependent oxidoreductase [Candidatus Hepatoplasma vulgare]|nr:MAG: NAD(P)H-dependent oxidoreductase [Candidatus Hepatoplasma sp.]
MLLDFATKRRATKNYNPDMFLKKEDLDYIFKVINTSPTSAGLEHWRVLCFRNKDKKNEILSGINEGNKKKFLDSSDALLFYVKKEEWFKNISNEDFYKIAKRNIEQVNQTFHKEITEDQIQTFMKRIRVDDHANNDHNLTEWSKRQAYIAAGYAFLAAKEINVESTPMEGFNEKILNKLLLEKGYINNLETIALIVLLGYSDGVSIPYFGKEQVRESIDKKFKIIY